MRDAAVDIPLPFFTCTPLDVALGAGVMLLLLAATLDGRLAPMSPVTDPTLEAMLMRRDRTRVPAGGSSTARGRSAIVLRRFALEMGRAESLSSPEPGSACVAGFLPRNCRPEGSRRAEASTGAGFSFLILGSASSSGLQLSVCRSDGINNLLKARAAVAQ